MFNLGDVIIYNNTLYRIAGNDNFVWNLWDGEKSVSVNYEEYQNFEIFSKR